MQYAGKRLAASSTICGVSILRAGETMEPALAEVCKDIRLGKILIQTNLDTGEPEVGQGHSFTAEVILYLLDACGFVVTDKRSDPKSPLYKDISSFSWYSISWLFDF